MSDEIMFENLWAEGVTPEQRVILMLRYGWDRNGVRRSLEETAEAMNRLERSLDSGIVWTRESLRQVEVRAVHAIRAAKAAA